MALINCPNCGHKISDKAKRCPHCEKILIDTSTPIANEIIDSNDVNTIFVSNYLTAKSKKSNHSWLWASLISLLIILAFCGVGGYYYYKNIYLQEKIDREAPRTYPIVNLQLRTSKMADVEFNKITTIPFGAELITYESDGEWAKVKYVSPNPNDKPLQGYVAASYLLNKQDFYIVNSIFGDTDSREVLETAKVRRALLEYYKSNGITGKISADVATDIGLTYNPDSQWQVNFRHGKAKPNEVLFKRIYNPSSKYTDMALFIENIINGERKILYVTFDDDETPHLRMVSDAPQNYDIKDMSLIDEPGISFDQNKHSFDDCKLKIVYSNGQVAFYNLTK